MSFTANILQRVLFRWIPFVNNAWSTFTAVPVIWREWELAELWTLSAPWQTALTLPLLCVFWGKVLVGYEADEPASSKGSEVFQLSPAFFSPLADGSQMFLADTLSVFVLFIPPVSLSLLSRILLASSFQCFPLFRSRTLDKSACFTLSDRNRPSPNKRSFSTLVLLFCVSSFPHPCFSFVCFFPSLSSFITHHLVWLRATAYCFSYSVPDLLMFLLCLTTDQTAFTIKCIAHVKTLWL